MHWIRVKKQYINLDNMHSIKLDSTSDKVIIQGGAGSTRVLIEIKGVKKKMGEMLKSITKGEIDE